MDNNAKHPAYGSGMSEWCASCHNQFLNDTGSTASTHRHPTGNSAELGATLATNYQQYKSTGNYSAGNVGTSYLWLVPVEFGVTTQSSLTASPSTGVTATSNVLCLSCHRAHASAFPSATRWDMGETFIADTAVNTTNIPSMVDNTAPWQGENIATVFPAGEYQRSLCNKCHVQD
jgi:predicted CXXCH cytochrome family protein